MRASLLFLVLMIGLALTDPPDTMTDFVPKDIARAAMVGCVVGGVSNAPDYAESFVIVRYGSKEKGTKVDYTPIIARRAVNDGGVFHAIEDCRDWFRDAKKQMEATVAEGKASKP